LQCMFSHKTPNTKHQIADRFDGLRIHHTNEFIPFEGKYTRRDNLFKLSDKY